MADNVKWRVEVTGLDDRQEARDVAAAIKQQFDVQGQDGRRVEIIGYIDGSE